MEWTDIRLTVSKADAEAAEAVATMIAEGGIYIEDYSDIEEQVEQIAHVDLIEQELLDKPRDTVIIHMYLEPGASPVETLALIAARMEAAGIPYTSETEGVEQEDWQNGWKIHAYPQPGYMVMLIAIKSNFVHLATDLYTKSLMRKSFYSLLPLEEGKAAKSIRSQICAKINHQMIGDAANLLI